MAQAIIRKRCWRTIRETNFGSGTLNWTLRIEAYVTGSVIGRLADIFEFVVMNVSISRIKLFQPFCRKETTSNDSAYPVPITSTIELRGKQVKELITYYSPGYVIGNLYIPRCCDYSPLYGFNGYNLQLIYLNSKTIRIGSTHGYIIYVQPVDNFKKKKKH